MSPSPSDPLTEALTRLEQIEHQSGDVSPVLPLMAIGYALVAIAQRMPSPGLEEMDLSGLVDQLFINRSSGQ